MTWGTLSAQAMTGRRIPVLRPASVAVVALFVALAALLTPGGSTPRTGSSSAASASGGLTAPVVARPQIRSAARSDGSAGARGSGPVSTVAARNTIGNAEPGVMTMAQAHPVGLIVRTAGATAGSGPLLVVAVLASRNPAPVPHGIRVADRSTPMPPASVTDADGARAPPGRI